MQTTEQVTLCDKCSSSFSLSNLKETEFGYFCKACMKKTSVTCAECEASEFNFRITRIDEKAICARCLKKSYIECNSCGIYVSSRLAKRYVPHGMSDDYVMQTCEDCYLGRDADGQINEYSYCPELKFSKMPWENTFYLGVELEINTHDLPSSHSKRFMSFLKEKQVGDRFFFKRDGSINGGYEIVSHPFTLQDSHHNIPWQEILGWLRENKATSYESGECGLHVHVSSKDMSLLDIGKLKIFMFRSAKQVIQFSKRKSMGYCKIEEFNKAKLNLFLQGLWHQDGRHVAVNVENHKGTVEFRIFRGTLYYSRFMASLQFAQSACEFVKDYGTGAIDSPRCWENFREFLRKKATYRILESYIQKEKIV